MPKLHVISHSYSLHWLRVTGRVDYTSSVRSLSKSSLPANPHNCTTSSLSSLLVALWHCCFLRVLVLVVQKQSHYITDTIARPRPPIISATIRAAPFDMLHLVVLSCLSSLAQSFIWVELLTTTAVGGRGPDLEGYERLRYGLGWAQETMY